MGGTDWTLLLDRNGLDFSNGLEQNWTLVMGWNKRFFFNGPGYHSQIGPYYGKGMDWTSVMGWIQESEAAFGRTLFF